MSHRSRVDSSGHERPVPRLRWGVGLACCVALATSLIFVAWAKMQTVQYTYAIDDLVDTEEDLANRQRILRSDLAAMRSPAKLHALAPSLGLAPPEPGHVVVITGDPEGLAAALIEDEDPQSLGRPKGDQP